MLNAKQSASNIISPELTKQLNFLFKDNTAAFLVYLIATSLHVGICI
mgnify:CR=1